MAYPDTAVREAQRLLERIQRGPVTMAADAPPGENREHRLAAAAGAYAYADRLASDIERGRVDEPYLRRAALVARAAECAGWLSADPVRDDRQTDASMGSLIDVGVFAFHPAVPGKYVACYRLVAPR